MPRDDHARGREGAPDDDGLLEGLGRADLRNRSQGSWRFSPRWLSCWSFFGGSSSDLGGSLTSVKRLIRPSVVHWTRMVTGVTDAVAGMAASQSLIARSP